MPSQRRQVWSEIRCIFLVLYPFPLFGKIRNGEGIRNGKGSLAYFKQKLFATVPVQDRPGMTKKLSRISQIKDFISRGKEWKD
jgi:hypothetical protein